MYSEEAQVGEVLTYIFFGWLIEETPDKERLIPQKEMPVFFMDKNNTYTSSGGRKFKIIKNPRGRWIVQSGDRKERVSIEWQL